MIPEASQCMCNTWDNISFTEKKQKALNVTSGWNEEWKKLNGQLPEHQLKIKPGCLSNYGFVFSRDLWYLWRCELFCFLLLLFTIKRTHYCTTSDILLQINHNRKNIWELADMFHFTSFTAALVGQCVSFSTSLPTKVDKRSYTCKNNSCKHIKMFSAMPEVGHKSIIKCCVFCVFISVEVKWMCLYRSTWHCTERGHYHAGTHGGQDAWGTQRRQNSADEEEEQDRSRVFFSNVFFDVKHSSQRKII